MESVLENKLISCYKDEMISWLKSHPEHFDEAIKLFDTLYYRDRLLYGPYLGFPPYISEISRVVFRRGS